MADIDRLIGFMAIMQVPFMNDPDALAYIEEVKTVLKQAKTQEPRVMTLEEAYNAELVWYEQKNTGVRPAKVIRVPHKTGVYRVMRFGDIDAWEHACEYGELWRCWTSRPTDEQREAVKWDG